LEGYFLVHEFSNWEKITFSLLNATRHVKDLVGNLVLTEGLEGTLTIFSCTYLEFFLRHYQGTILPCWEL